MAQKFHMDPQNAGAHLHAAGSSRAAALAEGIPALPTGNYLAGYSSLAAGTLDALQAELVAAVSRGMANTATSVEVVEATEAANRHDLQT
jgi:hypothetical protein